jgi:hypothetical protein
MVWCGVVWCGVDGVTDWKRPSVRKRRATHLAAEPFAGFQIVLRQLFFCQSTTRHRKFTTRACGVGADRQAEKNNKNINALALHQTKTQQLYNFGK